MPTATLDHRTVSDEEFEQIYREHYEDFLRYAISIFKNHGSQYVSASGRAEEAVQEMCAFAWEHRDRLAASPQPLGWMFRTLQYKVREFLREDRVWTKRMMQISEQHDSRDAHDFQLKAELEDIIPSKDYTLLKRLYLEGYTYAELCEEMGLNKSTLAMRVRRIKIRITDEFADERKFSKKRCEQLPPGGQFIVEEVHGDGT